MDYIQNMFEIILADQTAKSLLCLAILSGLVVLISKYFTTLKNKLITAVTTKASFKYSGTYYRPVAGALLHHVATNKGFLRVGAFRIDSEFCDVIDDKDMHPAKTRNIYRTCGVWFMIDVDVADTKPSEWNKEGTTTTIIITVLSRRADKLINLLNDMKKVYDVSRAIAVEFFMIEQVGERYHNRFGNEHIIDKQYATESYYELKNILSSFVDNRDTYINNGWKYRKGIILDGPPGTGKTSMVVKASKELGIKVCILSGLTIKNIENALEFRDSCNYSPLIILIDDIDRSDISKGKGVGGGNGDTDSEEDFGKLINILDGAVDRMNDTILIGTANDVKKLDSALLRDGRFDSIISVGNLSSEDAKGVVLNYLSAGTEEDIAYCTNKPISKATNYCIEKEKYYLAHKNT